MVTSSICISTGSQASALFSTTPTQKTCSSYDSDSLSRQRGTITARNVQPGTTHDEDVEFAAPFATTPIVIACLGGDINTGYSGVAISTRNLTPTGFTLRVANGTAGVVSPPLRWMAF